MTQSLISQTKAGFVAILGAPNAGKSTLLNQILGEKLSIVTHKAQTTRMRVLGLYTEGDTQIGLIDTPGIFRPKVRMEKAMVKAAWDSMEGADAILLIVDASSRQPDPRVEDILQELGKRHCKHLLLAFNKTDQMKVEKLLPLVQSFKEKAPFEEIFMISALTGDGVDALKKHLESLMPEGPWPYPGDQLTDLPERLLAAEITREQILLQLHEELPYAAAVIPEAWEERKDGSAMVRQRILVQRPNHRAIVLGKNGTRIKEIGQAARLEMTEQFGRPIHLFLDVKADERWQERNEYYNLFGLDLL
ncbi:MAG: GTPase Era [Proteobacteria bacterium]|jgi:GTP-binding protein Era|nr:GTPase Era [Alphaproteobacteria bacterium]NCC03076.1 GTPase Era [Pseudomonadota bacterium]